jgi:hypothetical protein
MVYSQAVGIYDLSPAGLNSEVAGDEAQNWNSDGYAL